MPIGIPLRGDLPFFDLQIDLDGATYTLQLRWNERALRTLVDGTVAVGAWFLTVLDEASENVLLGDLKLVANWPLDVIYTERPWPGFLVAWDTSGAGVDPGEPITTTAAGLAVSSAMAQVGQVRPAGDLGSRVKLVYFTAADVAPLGL